MIEELLMKNEGKTLEFKEEIGSLRTLVKTVIAFANTAGGTIVIGIRDKTKEIVGVECPLDDEEKIDNSLMDQISPLLIPDIEIITYKKKQLLVIQVPHTVGPFYLQSLGPEEGTYIRFGSTNRAADEETRKALTLLHKRLSFDELPNREADESGLDESILDWDSAEGLFDAMGKKLTESRALDLGIIVRHGQTSYPSHGGILLFSPKRAHYFPDSLVRCARFQGRDKEVILDELEIKQLLPLTVDHVISFIQRNTPTRIEIGKGAHKRIPQYPEVALREALTNALLHADYAMQGSNITIAIFEDRLEITNPGSLMFGLSLDRALAGSSRLRNKVIGRVFKELRLIEQWGSGLQRIIALCIRAGLPHPKFEELNNHFMVTLYGIKEEQMTLLPWQTQLIDHIREHKKVTIAQAAELWQKGVKTARNRIKELIERGIISRIATSKKDPTAFFILMHDPMSSWDTED